MEYIYGLSINYAFTDELTQAGETFIYSDEPLGQIAKRQLAKSISKALGVSTYKIVDALHLYTLPDGSPAQRSDLFKEDEEWTPPTPADLADAFAMLSQECDEHA
jgi:hypothetical protein